MSQNATSATSAPVIVVGAGAAGITATYRLRRAGVPVICFEASDHPCGRTTTVTVDGFTLQTGALGIETQWTTEVRLLDELGMRAEMRDVMPMRLGSYRKGRWNLMGMGSKEDKALWKAELKKYGWGGPTGMISGKGIRGVLGAGLAMKKEADKIKKSGENPHDNYWAALSHLDKVSLQEFVLEHGNRDALEFVFRPFMNVMVASEPDEVGVAHMISLLYDILNAENNEGGAYCAMERGMGSIYQAAYEKDRECYRLNTPVQEIRIKDGRAMGVLLTSGEFVPADDVICCVTASQARDIIPALPQPIAEDLSTVHYCEILYYYLCSRENFGPNSMSVGVLPRTKEDPNPKFMTVGNTVQGCFNRVPNGKGTTMTMSAAKSFMPEFKAMSEAEREACVLAEARRLFPDMPEKLDLIYPVYWKEGISQDAPGQHDAILNYYTKHAGLVGGLHLAGEYLVAQASAEGAAYTGEKAAMEVIAKYGK